MYASSIIALGLSATAVSAAAFPSLEVRQTQACDPYCQFPVSLDCPFNGSTIVMMNDLIEAVQNDPRDGPPSAEYAGDYATRHCSTSEFEFFPLWTTEFSNGTVIVGDLQYTSAPNGTFFFCDTMPRDPVAGTTNACLEYYS